MSHVISWMEEERISPVMPRKQPDNVFIRFGKWSRGMRSTNFAFNKHERGLSVYPARFIDGAVAPDYAEMDICILVEGRLAFPVTGKVVGLGSDGEPVIVSVKLLAYPLAFMEMPEFLRKVAP